MGVSIAVRMGREFDCKEKVPASLLEKLGGKDPTKSGKIDRDKNFSLPFFVMGDAAHDAVCPGCCNY